MDLFAGYRNRRFACSALLAIFGLSLGVSGAAGQAAIPACRDAGNNFDLSRGLAGTSFDASRLAAPDRALVARDAMLGDHVVRLTWLVGDRAAGGPRAELADQCLPAEGVPIFTSLSFLIPHNLPLDAGGSVTIAQFHTASSNHKPVVALRYRASGHLDVTLNHLVPKAPGETPRSLQIKPLRFEDLPRGQWHTIGFLAVWSSGADGRLDIVFDGRPVFRYRGKTNFPDQNGAGPYFKFGVYPSEGNSKPLSVEYARYERVGKPGDALLKARGFGGGKGTVYRVGDPRIVVPAKR